MKPDTSIIQKKHPFIIPSFSNNVHHEIEVVIQINRLGKYIERKFADKYYNKLTVGIDFTARDIQNNLIENGLPWEKSKSFDGSALIGDWIEKKSLLNINSLNFFLKKNDKVVQRGNTSLMLWKIDEIISHISKFFTLKIGDLIFTGTPAGVGAVSESDFLEGFIEEIKCFEVKIK